MTAMADMVGGAGIQIAIGALTLAGLLVLWVIRKGYKGIVALVRLAEIITGKPAVGKQPAVPGIAERLANIEYELKTNGGSSLRDVVSKTYKLAGENAQRVEAARQLAETAVTKADELTAVTAANEERARTERRLQQQALEGLLAGLDDFAGDVHAKDMAYQRALRALGYDITKVTDALTGDGP